MNFKSLFALLAIFVVIMSASAVCADDATDTTDPATGVADTGDPDEDEPVEDEGDDIAEEGDDDVNGTDAPIVISPGVDEAEGSASGASETPLSNNAAGNPILVLLAALAVLGVIPFKRN